MSRESIERLIDRWMNDMDFRAELRRDPEAAVRASGEELSADEWEALRNVDWSLSDEELLARASMGG